MGCANLQYTIQQFIHKLSKHASIVHGKIVHLENYTLRNKRPSCCSIEHTFFQDITWNIAVFSRLIRVVQKNRPILLFIPKVCFTIFSIFLRWCRQQTCQILLIPIWIQLDNSTTQQPIKIIEAYFAAKSVLLTQRKCRKDFEKNNVPDRRTIQRLMARFRETESMADVSQRPQWSTSFKSFKSNKPGSFSIVGRFSCFILISLPPQDLSFERKELNVIMEDPQNWCSRNNSFFERQRVDFLGDSSRRRRKSWIFSGIMLNDERCRSLWASATFFVFRNLATKRWIILLSGILFLPKSLLHCHCVRRTDFVAKYASMIFIRCCVV